MPTGIWQPHDLGQGSGRWPWHTLRCSSGCTSLPPPLVWGTSTIHLRVPTAQRTTHSIVWCCWGTGRTPPLYAGMARPWVVASHTCCTLCPHCIHGSWTTSCSYFVGDSYSAFDFYSISVSYSTSDSYSMPYWVPVAYLCPWPLNAHSPDSSVLLSGHFLCRGHCEGLAGEVSWPTCAALLWVGKAVIWPMFNHGTAGAGGPSL